MKKLSFSISPYIMMIIPVILFLSLSFVLKDESHTKLSSTNLVKNKNTEIVQTGDLSVKQSLLKLLLK